MDYEDELDLLSTVAVTQIGADGRAHLDFHCNEHRILLKSIPLKESWDVVRKILVFCSHCLFPTLIYIPLLFTFQADIEVVL